MIMWHMWYFNKERVTLYQQFQKSGTNYSQVQKKNNNKNKTKTPDWIHLEV